MRFRAIIFDGEPVQIRRYRMECYGQPMYEIRLLNYQQYVSHYSVPVGVDLRKELELSLLQLRGIVSNREWLANRHR